MTTLIVGANGATGSLLLSQLLNQDEKVKIIVRSTNGLPAGLIEHPQLTLIQSNVLDMTETELNKHVKGCRAVVSCLGHNLSFKGIYGHPRRLVTDAVQRLCNAIETTSGTSAKPVKFILMNTTGNQNQKANERVSRLHKITLNAIRFLIPPHADNEEAAAYLQSNFVTNKRNCIEWVAVRPDTLTDEVSVSEYEIYPSPIRDALFDSGLTSRINVGNFMTKLITKESIWDTWKNQMPVIYNA